MTQPTLRHVRSLEAFLFDLDELVEPLVLNGLAVFDPALPADLLTLAERAWALGLQSLAPLIEQLALALEAIAAPSAQRRRSAMRGAFEAWQRVLAFRRLLGREIDRMRAGLALRHGP